MQSYTINNVRNLYDSRQKIINLRNDNAKQLSPKQILRILPIALAQVKAGNNSESLFSEFLFYLGKLFIVFISQHKSLKSIQ